MIPIARSIASYVNKWIQFPDFLRRNHSKNNVRKTGAIMSSNNDSLFLQTKFLVEIRVFFRHSRFAGHLGHLYNLCHPKQNRFPRFRWIFDSHALLLNQTYRGISDIQILSEWQVIQMVEAQWLKKYGICTLTNLPSPLQEKFFSKYIPYVMVPWLCGSFQ